MPVTDLGLVRGPQGEQGPPGIPGTNGEPGQDGKSAYELAVENGYTGSVTDWLESLKGADGAQGPQGVQGAPGANATINGVNTLTLTGGTNIELRQTGSDLEIASTAVNTNLLINSYFVNPINQRGQTEYSSSSARIYTIDRFFIARAKLQVIDDRISIAWDGVTSNMGFAAQRVEIPNLNKKTFTFSVLTGDNYLISRTILIGDKINTNYGDAIFEHSICLMIGNVDNLIAECIIYINSTTPIDLQAAKLELGTHQTLAHQDADGKWVLNEIPDPTLELLKCQRYFQPCGDPVVQVISDSVISVSFKFAVPMRSIPTIKKKDNSVTVYTDRDITFTISDIVNAFAQADGVKYANIVGSFDASVPSGVYKTTNYNYLWADADI